jgi:N-acetylneuraminate synthase
MEFTAEQWAGLAYHAKDRGIIFLSSPFSEEAIEMLNKIGMPAWKIASGETRNPLIKEAMYATGKPILLSTGMSSLEEIDKTVIEIEEKNLPLAVFQCTSKYPSPPEEIGLNMIPLFKERYKVPVGLSDHSGKIYSGLAAATIGANLIEVHVTMSREMFGPDVPVSLTTKELQQLVEGVRFIEKIISNPVDKLAMADELSEMRKMFGKGLVLKHSKEKGAILVREDFTSKKPAAGIPADQIDSIIGKRLVRTIQSGDFLQPNDIEE